MAVVRMSFTMPAGLQRRMRQHREVNWSGVVRKIVEERLALLEELDRVFSRSRLEKADVEEFSALIDRRMAGHYKKAMRSHEGSHRPSASRRD